MTLKQFLCEYEHMKKKRKLRSWVKWGLAIVLCLAGISWLQKKDEKDVLILQKPEFPNGCEITSLTMLLQMYGYHPSVDLLYDQYLAKGEVTLQDGMLFGPDPEMAYGGDARSEDGGWYCYEQPLAQAGNNYLISLGKEAVLVGMQGITIEQLDELVNQGPVVCWVTIGFEAPLYSTLVWNTGMRTFQPLRNLHCLVVRAKTIDGYAVLDPLRGSYTVEEMVFQNSFASVGSRVVYMQ